MTTVDVRIKRLGSDNQLSLHNSMWGPATRSPDEAIRVCVEELGKLHSDSARAQVYATLSLREAVLELAAQLARGANRGPAEPETQVRWQSEGLRQVQAYLDQADE